MQLTKLSILLALILIFSGIATIFWYQETRYILPTPIPENHQDIAIGNAVAISAITGVNSRKPALMHFFNPDCPCSRFNMDHFRRLVEKYKHEFDFYAVLQVEDEKGALERFQEKYSLGIPVIIDKNKKLAAACGVYSTPQAAIIDQNGILYYRGNYNKARYCTSPESNFTQMAIDSLLTGKAPPVFSALATRAYGCELPAGTLEATITNFKY